MRFTPFLVFLFLAAIPSAVTLAVSTQGNGYVSSSPSGILCGAACAESYDSGTQIVLTATTNGGPFKSWSGDCTGFTPTCTLLLDSDKAVTAVFEGQTFSEYLLTIYRTGNGLGIVTSTPYGISLGSIAPYDSARFQAGSTVVLTASPQQGSRFDGWTGACTGKESACTVAVDAAKSITAVFSTIGSPFTTLTPSSTPTLASPASFPSLKPATTPKAISATPSPSASTPTPAALLPTTTPSVELTVAKSGAGRGAVFLWPEGRMQNLCGSSDKECVFQYPYGTAFTFQTMPLPDSEFAGWSGECNGAAACTLVLNSSKRLTANFGLAEIQKASHESQVIVPPVPNRSTPSPTPPYIPRGTPMPTPSGQQAIYPLVVRLSSGGVVKSSDGRINCGEYGNSRLSQCEANYARYNEVPLTAVPSKGFKFIGWGGACRSFEGPSCKALIESSSLFIASTEARAVFEPLNQVLTVAGSEYGFVSADGFKINCPNICSASYKNGQTAVLTAWPKGTSTFERWGGACASSTGSSCSILMDENKHVQAFFKGPPSRKKVSIEFNGPYGNMVTITSTTSLGTFPVKTCDQNCTVDFQHNTPVELVLKQADGSVWEGWGGACIGNSGNCYLNMDSDKVVTLKFSKSSFNLLTVVRPQQGVVVSDSQKIACGETRNECAVYFDNRSRPVLTFSDGLGLFESGCDAVWKRTNQYGSVFEECVLNMNKNRTVKTKLSPEQEKWIVGKALGESFDRQDYPNLKHFTTSEEGVPFQKTLAAFKSGKAGKTSAEVKNWISHNYDFFLKDTGIAKFMYDYDSYVVKRAIYYTFYDDIEKRRYDSWFKKDELVNYINDESKKPFTRGLREFLARHKDGEVKFYDFIKQSKNSYYEYEGIKPFFIAPTSTPTPPKYIHGPTVFGVHPKDSKIGNQPEIDGSGFDYVTEVLLNGKPIRFEKTSNIKIVLPDIRWGIEPGVRTDSPAILTLINSAGGKTTKKLTEGSAKLNADGKEEECFGAVGKGCGGLFGVKGGDSSSFMWRAGCEAERKATTYIGTERVCRVAAGSIRHDNCCVRFPSGKWCGGPGNDGKPAEEFNHDGNCANEWHEAFWDVFWGRAWEETIDTTHKAWIQPAGSRNNRYPQGEALASINLCAPKGHELREEKDAPFCCSGKMGWWKKCE